MSSLLNHVRQSRYAFEYRITILGDKMTGKSSLLSRYTSNTFTHRYRPTIEEQVPHIVQHQGAVCVCLFIDTCGGNDFPAMRRLEISKGNAFMVVYAINNRNSFDTSKRIVEEIKEEKVDRDELKIMLVGTKSDMSEHREVEYEEGELVIKELQQQYIKAEFYEVSAMDSTNVSLVFDALLGMYVKPERLVIRRRSSLSRLSLRRQKKSSSTKSKEAAADILKRNSLSDTELDRISSACMRVQIPQWENPTKGKTKMHRTTSNEEQRSSCTLGRQFRSNSTSPNLRLAITKRHHHLVLSDNIPRKGSSCSASEADVSTKTLFKKKLSNADVRCNSASPKLLRRGAAGEGGGEGGVMKDTKHFFQRTFDSMQRILSASNSPSLFRSWSYDSSKKNRLAND